MKTHVPFTLKLMVLTVCISLCTQLVSADVQAADKTYDLNIKFAKGAQHRVDMQFEHKGKVILDETGEKSGYKTLPMDTIARLGYYQRYTGSASDNQAVRFYDKSKGKFRISKGIATAELSDNNRLVVTRVRSKAGQRVQMASALSTLNHAELELLKNPLDPLSLSSMINKKGVKIGEKWTPNDEGLANFLAIDRVIQNDVRMYIKDVEDGIARVYILGKLRAAVDDVMTELELTSIIKVALKEEMVTTVRLGIREVRQPGQLAPGFDGRTTVDLKVVNDKSCKHLTNESLKKYTKSRVIEQKLKWESAQGAFQLKYDPRWRLITGEQEAAILRYLNNGMLLAQCNVVQLPARPATKPLTLEEYKHEIAKIVAKDPNAKIVDSGQFNTKQNTLAYKVEVQGVEGGVDVKWHYYHVANKDGRRMTFVFTLEKDVEDVFQPADKSLVESLKFFPVKTQKRSAKSVSTKDSTRR